MALSELLARIVTVTRSRGQLACLGPSSTDAVRMRGSSFSWIASELPCSRSRTRVDLRWIKPMFCGARDEVSSIVVGDFEPERITETHSLLCAQPDSTVFEHGTRGQLDANDAYVAGDRAAPSTPAASRARVST